MAFTTGKYGIASVINPAMLVATFELTSFLFLVVILGAVCFYNDFSVFALICYIKEKAALVLGTSSSEAVLTSLMERIEKPARSAQWLALSSPTDYSFNLDSPSIHMKLAALFIAQAADTHLTLTDQILLLLVAILSSKGAAGVTGAGFITLAATLSALPTVPVAGMGLILGINRFMSEYLTTTNFIGNDAQTKSRIDPNAGFGRSLVKSMRKQEAKQVIRWLPTSTCLEPVE